MTLEESKNVQIGDLIELKSGSPKMIVRDKKNNFISCILWDETSENKICFVDNLDYAFLVKCQ
jgi:uncharacterized protein YodC (DUF2158 family)